MYLEEVTKISGAASKKSEFCQKGKGRYLVSSMLAGMYVGLGILLIFTIGGLVAPGDPALAKILMGVSFGIALSLVVMAGAELFTGNNLVMTVGQLENQVTVRDAVTVYLFSFGGNLIGSVLLACLFVFSGLASGSTAALILKTAQLKMALPWSELLVRGILCNTLVCLAIWCSYKMKEESGKLLMIFWCLFAFITTGFEHSVANMTLLAAALLLPGGAGVSWAGFVYNLAWVTLGNFIGGALLVGCSYWYIAKEKQTVKGE